MAFTSVRSTNFSAKNCCFGCMTQSHFHSFVNWSVSVNWSFSVFYALCTLGLPSCKAVKTGHLTHLTQHGSADTVVRAMNAFNGKCRFSGYASSETLERFSQKIGTVDYCRGPHPHERIGVNRFKGSVSAHAWNCHPQASIFFLFFPARCM